MVSAICTETESVWCPQELERSWKEYEQLEADVTLARTNLLEQLGALGSPQVTHTPTPTQSKHFISP